MVKKKSEGLHAMYSKYKYKEQKWELRGCGGVISEGLRVSSVLEKRLQPSVPHCIEQWTFGAFLFATFLQYLVLLPLTDSAGSSLKIRPTSRLLSDYPAAFYPVFVALQEIRATQAT